MRTIIEIINAVKDCEPVTKEELKLAFLSIHYWSHATWLMLSNIAKEDKLPWIQLNANNSVNSYTKMMKAQLDRYLSPILLPGTKENKEVVELTKKVDRKYGLIE